MATRRLATGILAISALVLVGTPVAWLSSRPDAAVGTVPATRPSSTPERPVAVRPSPVRQIRVHSVRAEDQPKLRSGPLPVGVSIPAIDVVAPVVPVGVDGFGGVEIPDDVSTVGWYRFGPTPGGSGSAALIGHVDARAQGPGVFFHLVGLEPGALVVVRFGDGSSRTFEVVGRRSYAKDELPARVFARGGKPVLSLITCGGAFDRQSRHYADNVVVYAVPRK